VGIFAIVGEGRGAVEGLLEVDVKEIKLWIIKIVIVNVCLYR